MTRVPRRSSEFSASPRSWLTDGEWPHGALADDAPPPVKYAAHVAGALSAALVGRNKTDVARAAGIERSTLYDVLAGNTWADLVTLAKIEVVLNVSLWPSEPPGA